MKNTSLIFVLTILLNTAFAQVSINEDNSNPDASAMLDIKSTDKGMLIPRMSTIQRTTISSPATGLLVFDTNTSNFWFYNGTVWESLSGISSEIADDDNDTKIQVEESADDDIIRFDIGGTEYFRMDKGRLETLATVNVFIGHEAGVNDNLNVHANVFIGSQSGVANHHGYYAVAYGYQSLYSNTTGIFNTANGAMALYANTTGHHSTANGYQALYSTISKEFNTANGCQALYSTITGEFNTANGYQALYLNTSGTKNTVNGSKALHLNTSGWNNTATGCFSLYANTSVDGNTASGYQSLYANTTGDKNTAHGYLSLFSNTTGSKNTALGYYADVLSGNLTNATAIGSSAKVATSNSLILGGTGSNAVNVGIGTSAPENKLHLGEVGGIQLTNSEITNVNESEGTFLYDANYYATGEAGDGHFNGNGGGMAIYDDNGWSAIVSTANMQYLEMDLSSLHVGGTSDPGDNNLIIDGVVKIEGGNPGIDKVLMADINGNATWEDPQYVKLIYAKNSVLQGFPAASNTWRAVTPWTATTTNDNTNAVFKLKGALTSRLTNGGGIDEFQFRVEMVFNGTTFYSEEISYRPDQSTGEHNNFRIVSYLDQVDPPNSGGTAKFRLQAKNTGDDAWEVRDCTLLVKKY